jgi:ketosteroid isomerase-like protein
MKSTKTSEQLQEEVRKAELEFAQMAAKEGIAEAFYFYADENAVLNRNNQLIDGKEAIKSYMSKTDYKNITLEWKPTKIEVAESGDLAYTFGDYTYSKMKEDGSVDTQKGIFHTVWKRQENGAWRYVWD